MSFWGKLDTFDVDTNEKERIQAGIGEIHNIINSSSKSNIIVRKTLITFMNLIQCDRAWLLYPCNPYAETYRIPIECARPHWPGAKVDGIDIPVDSHARDTFLLALKENKPVCFDAKENSSFLKADVMRDYHIKSQLLVTVKSVREHPFLLGIHNCEKAKKYSKLDCAIIEEIASQLNLILSKTL